MVEDIVSYFKVELDGGKGYQLKLEMYANIMELQRFLFQSKEQVFFTRR